MSLCAFQVEDAVRQALGQNLISVDANSSDDYRPCVRIQMKTRDGQRILPMDILHSQIRDVNDFSRKLGMLKESLRRFERDSSAKQGCVSRG